MRFSVVINTYNRGPSLRATLAGLRRQAYDDFEVVVVNGPSTDDTAAVLAEFAGDLRAFRCPDVHLSKSRNVGITHAAGDVVAFIDDDAVPTPTWLSGLAAAYADDPALGGAGGVVYDHTGASFQYEYSACGRDAVPRFDIKPPFDTYTRPGADPFLYLQGTNCSFRRTALAEIGGFNEEIEYYLDETEVCMRVIDAGHALVSLPAAAVHHKYLPSAIRDHKRVVSDPYSSVKNHCCFAARNGPVTRPMTEVLESIGTYISQVKAGGRANRDAGLFTAAQLAHFERRADLGAEVGLKMGLNDRRPMKRIPPPNPAAFRPFPTLRPAAGRLKVCFVSREFPPDTGGVGRFTSDLARGYADRGHEVYVVTHANSNRHTVDFEDGVWMHRIPAVAPKGKALADLALAHNYTHAANVYHEVSRIHAGCGGLDVVSAPIWLCEGVVCQLDDRWPTVLALQTTMKTIAGMGGTTADPVHVNGMVALEAATVAGAGNIHAISRAILAKTKDEIGRPTAAAQHVVHLGTRDVRDDYPRTRPADDGTVRILYVGRIEARKGVDILLAAAREILPEFPAAELVLVGKMNPAGGDAVPAAHAAFAAENPAAAARIRFAGELDDADLMRAYADCDVFVLPSRYESFGLVLTEAMMFGKPVVAGRAGGMPEIVAEGENGFLADIGDPHSYAAALRKLVADAGLRRRFGAKSRELYEAKFSADVMVTATIAAHRDIVRRFRPGPGAGVAAGLKALVRDTSGVSAEIAGEVAAALLSKRFRNAVDHGVELADLWHKSDEEFVRGAYQLLFARPADGGGLADAMNHLAAGGSRLDRIEWMVYSAESRVRRLDTDWFPEFVPPLRPVVAAAPVAAPTGTRVKARRLVGRVKRKLLAAPVLGRGLRLARHVVLMPRTVRRLHAETARLAAAVAELNAKLATDQQAALRTIREAQRELATDLAAATAAAEGRDRQLQFTLAAWADDRYPPRPLRDAA